MKQITAVTDDPIQEFSVTLDDGTILTFESLIYVPSQQVWFYTLSYGTIWPKSDPLSNQQMVNSPNLLRKYKNLIPFGLCCTVIDGYEIVNQSDFVSGRASLYVLNPTDVMETEILITQTLPRVAGIPAYQL